MTAKQGQILPFFIPHLGCPCRCVFCDQQKISGENAAPTAEEIDSAINDLAEPVELAFYGGSFTALPVDLQKYFLTVAKQALYSGKITGIRVSTRPDAIDDERIELLMKYGVKTVELGVQSMQDEVLIQSRRGHTASDSINALKKLKNAGFIVGVQLMPGLPGSTTETDFTGAEKILSLKPDLLRIYPTVIIADTELADMYRAGKYQALTLEEATLRSADILALADYYDIKVIRIGLNPTDNLSRKVLAGAYHPALGNMVKSALFKEQMLMLLQLSAGKTQQFGKFVVHRQELSHAFGQNGCNKEDLQAALGERQLKISGNGTAVGTVELLCTDGSRYSLNRGDFIKLYVETRQKNLTTSC